MNLVFLFYGAALGMLLSIIGLWLSFRPHRLPKSYYKGLQQSLLAHAEDLCRK